MFIYEKRDEPMLSQGKFILRIVWHALVAIGIVIGSLAIGVLGYHYLENLTWIDALLNSAMLLGGMGPVNPLYTVVGKLFASFYALFAGLVFLVVTSILFAPVFHRLIHHFHIELEND